MLYLKESTASQSVLLGPFVDEDDGKTAETGLTIANTDIRLSKNGGNMAAKNSGGGTHDEAGWYTATLDATDTNTVGRLQVSVHVAGALPVFAEFQVIESDIYDAYFASGATGIPTAMNNLSAAQVNAECDTALTDYDGPTNAEMNARTLAAANYATAAVCTETRLAELDAANLPADVDSILVDTGTSGVVIAAAQTVATVTDVTNQVTADVTAISGDATAADNLEASLETLVPGTATGGTTSTVTSGTTGHGDDTFIGRVLLFRSGTLQYEAGVITDYESATGTFTFAASTWTTSPTTETFVVV